MAFWCVNLNPFILKDKTELKELFLRLEKDGVPPKASSDERQCHLWRLLRSTEGSLASATQELQALREQQASEMKEASVQMAGLGATVDYS